MAREVDLAGIRRCDGRVTGSGRELADLCGEPGEPRNRHETDDRRDRGYSRPRMSQRSGKAGLNSVFRRYSAPAEPPLPGFIPIVRSTIFTCR